VIEEPHCEHAAEDALVDAVDRVQAGGVALEEVLRLVQAPAAVVVDELTAGEEIVRRKLTTGDGDARAVEQAAVAVEELKPLEVDRAVGERRPIHRRRQRGQQVGSLKAADMLPDLTVQGSKSDVSVYDLLRKAGYLASDEQQAKGGNQ